MTRISMLPDDGAALLSVKTTVPNSVASTVLSLFAARLMGWLTRTLVVPVFSICSVLDPVSVEA